MSTVSSKRHYQKTRRGKVLHIVKERYLRDDLGFGACSSSGALTPLPSEVELLATLREEYLEKSNGLPLLLVLDTNITLAQLDALESTCPVVKNIVLCSTVLGETKKRSKTCAARLLQLCMAPERAVVVFPNENHANTFEEKQKGESDNDYNDRLGTVLIPTMYHLLTSHDVAYPHS